MEERNKGADLEKLANATIENLEFRNDFEYGAPGLDQRRPFGNSGVEEDIMEIIGMKPVADDYFSEEQKEYARSLFCNELVPYMQKRWKELKAPATEKKESQ